MIRKTERRIKTIGRKNHRKIKKNDCQQPSGGGTDQEKHRRVTVPVAEKYNDEGPRVFPGRRGLYKYRTITSKEYKSPYQNK